MKLAVSNIAWSPEKTPVILPGLRGQGVEGLVIAPTMVWPEAPAVSDTQIEEFKKVVEEEGLVIAALQSLVYGRNDLALFGDAAPRRRLIEHLKRQAELGGRLGASSIIFGSPGLRQEKIDDQSDAVNVFEEVAQTADEEGMVLAIEPLSGYGNQFVTTTQEGIDLVYRVNHRGFGLHLDSAAITAAGESASTISSAQGSTGIMSFDAAAPELARPSRDKTVPHSEMANALREGGYGGFVSLEMKQPNSPKTVAEEITFIKSYYQ